MMSLKTAAKETRWASCPLKIFVCVTYGSCAGGGGG